MKYFEDTLVLARAYGWLVPPDNTFEDCMCHVILTEDYLYVCEDNFGDRWDTLFKISAKDVVSAEIYLDERCEKSGGNSFKADYLASVLSALTGVVLPTCRQEKAPAKYLKIACRSENRALQNIFFSECNHAIKIIKAFQKLSE